MILAKGGRERKSYIVSSLLDLDATWIFFTFIVETNSDLSVTLYPFFFFNV